MALTGERKVLLIEDNPGDARLVREMLSDSREPTFRVLHAESLVAALNALVQSDFDVVLMDLSLPDSQGKQTFTSVQSHAPGLPIVVLTGIDSESMALEAVSSGVQDYLVKGKLTTSSLVRALEYAVIRHSKSERQDTVKKARLIGMLSGKGGVGTTTIACHYAVELARQTEQKVLLTELDSSSAVAGFLMKINANHDMSDAADNLHRLDVQLWKGLVSATPFGFDYLPTPGGRRFGYQLSSERVRHVLRFARPLYGWILVDFGRLDAVSKNLLEETSDMYVITTPELPALYEAKRVLNQLLDLGLKRERVRLVMNRALKSSGSELRDIEKALGYSIHGVLADYSNDLHDAYSDGRLLDSGSPLHKDIRKLIGKFVGTAPV